ncbi:MAG: hypothetical protein F6K00_31340 [Leptolyngbya sp. SIOISBB]|nr:hypothetical protein [Leptolyngbya sp. SIOISBB]
MEQQLILNFLNLPGIVGLGLMDGHSRPYFSGIGESLNVQQKEVLTEGIQQVISTTPPGFQSFDFKFSQQDVRLYRLDNDMILLVVTDKQLDHVVYENTVAQLKETLESDPLSTISTFRFLAGSQPRPPITESATATTEAAEELANPEEVDPQASVEETSNRFSTTTWGDYLTALNTLTDATAQYLGKIVVANTWRTTRPDDEQLNMIQLDRNGHFSLSTETKVAVAALIEAAIHAALHQWVSTFVKRCTMIIRDYEAMVIEQQLTAEQRALLQVGQASSDE